MIVNCNKFRFCLSCFVRSRKKKKNSVALPEPIEWNLSIINCLK